MTARHAGALRVLVADHEAATREGVRLSLESHGFGVCAACPDAKSAISGAQRHGPDVCIVDADLPGGGVRTVAELQSLLPETSIIVLTDAPEEQQLFQALRAGALGYVDKRVEPGRIAHIVEGVLRGESAVPRMLMTHVIDEFRGHGARRRLAGAHGPVSMSSREWEILELLCAGMSTAGIAAHLYLSPVTVRRHVSRIVQRLEVEDRDAAIRAYADSTQSATNGSR